jgi:hypothetical protein
MLLDLRSLVERRAPRPTWPDSARIDAALLAKLRQDSVLTALLPGGIWFDLAPPDVTAYGIVSLAMHDDVAVFGRRAWEDTLYLVKAVVRMPGPARAAAARIDELLEDGTLAIAGFALMALERELRLRLNETDPERGDRWQQRGGYYRLQASIDPMGLTRDRPQRATKGARS